jgi:hypothetical protein
MYRSGSDRVNLRWIWNPFYELYGKCDKIFVDLIVSTAGTGSGRRIVFESCCLSRVSSVNRVSRHRTRVGNTCEARCTRMGGARHLEVVLFVRGMEVCVSTASVLRVD